MNYIALHEKFKEKAIQGRYIPFKKIEPLLLKYSAQVVGESVFGKPIYKYEIGKGKIKVLMWSQMHGNEGTTTKALFDFLNFLNSGQELSESFLGYFTFCLLPMVNPDGSDLYTRENGNKVDLNRDANALTQPESKVLRKVFDIFQPDYCYNLHDQRTIFGAGDTGNPATVSFLSPAYNEAREINDVRIKAMNVIVAMNEVLQKYIPNQVGRFDDGFNINCIGDTFQSLNVPTILFEAGHFPGDYEREETRKYIFIAMVSGLEFLLDKSVFSNRTEEYLSIPQNKVNFFDFVYKNVKINYESDEKIINFAAQYRELLIDEKIVLEARIAKIDDLENYFGHIEIDAKEEIFNREGFGFPNIDEKAVFYLGNDIKIVNGMNKN